MRKITFVSSCAIILALSGCKPNYEKLHFSRSYERFRSNYDYEERIEDVQIFFKQFAKAFTQTIRDSFPGFSQLDALSIGNPYKAKLALSLSNTREEFLLITKGAPEMRVAVSNFPVQYALGRDYDYFYNTKGIDPTGADFLRMLKVYDLQAAPKTVANTANYFYTNDSLESSNRFIALGNYSMAVLNNIVLLGNNEEGRVRFNANGFGFLTAINGFGHWKDSAEAIGKTLAVAEVKRYCFSSSLFSKALTSPELSSLAREMLAKENMIGPDGNSLYTCHEFQADNNKLIQVAKASAEGVELADHLEKFQQQEAKNLFIVFSKLPGRDDFIFQWMTLNFLVLAVLLFTGYTFKTIPAVVKKGEFLLMVLLILIQIWGMSYVSEDFYLQEMLIPVLMAAAAVCLIIYHPLKNRYNYRW